MVSQWPVDPATGICHALVAPGRYRIQPLSAGAFGSNVSTLETDLAVGWNDLDFSPGNVTEPANRLGVTPGRNWDDVPPAGSAFFYRVTSP